MTKAEWVKLIAKEFVVSNETAKTMLHAMIKVKESKDAKHFNTMADALYRSGYRKD